MQNKRVLMLIEIAIFATLAYVLDFFTLFKMPQGGSVTLSMVPIFIVAIRWGLKAGIVSGAIFGFLQLIYGGYVISIIQGLFEYVVAFAALGVAGIFSKQIIQGLNNDNKFSLVLWILVATFIASSLRFVGHFVAGIVWFAHFAPEGQSVWAYSFGYNLAYMLPSFVLAAVICIIIFVTRPKLILQNA